MLLREIVHVCTQREKYCIYELRHKRRLFQSVKRRQGMRRGSLKILLFGLRFHRRRGVYQRGLTN